MRVDSAGVDHALVAPYVVQQFIAILHTSPALDQRSQQFELKTGEIHSFAADANLMARRVDRDRAGLERFLLLLTSPQNCPDSQGYFPGTERLRYVIVSAKLQTNDAIDLFGLGRQ